MPRSSLVPKYCLHKPSGRAYVRIHGKVIYAANTAPPRASESMDA